ncbi:hypothetical protein [Sphingomonas hankookensis]|uniref:Uncharacterized protein n=1 Tax=Sphingomonas hengshuiensis TaxID=1609977 RepID=A0A2W4YXU4_9SPHN|nr:MAG: hypothetical protein DI632_13240 [Sphingomonas hengshuiensis]
MGTGWVALASAVLVTPAMAQDADADAAGSGIVVTGHKPLRVDATILRAAQARFAKDRAQLAPQGVLRFELWRGANRVRADGVKLMLVDAAGTQLPVGVDGDGRLAFPPVPKGRWFLTAPAHGAQMSLRPIILSRGTGIDDRRLGDLRLQCRVMVSMARTQAPVLAMPLIGLFDVIGGCASKRFGFYHLAEHPLASAVAVASGRREPVILKLSARRDAYLAPLSDRALDNETRIRTTYQ